MLNPVLVQALVQSSARILEHFANLCESFRIRTSSQSFCPGLSAINQRQHVRGLLLRHYALPFRQNPQSDTSNPLTTDFRIPSDFLPRSS
jgi:hypothetical protein